MPSTNSHQHLCCQILLQLLLECTKMKPPLLPTCTLNDLPTELLSLSVGNATLFVGPEGVCSAPVEFVWVFRKPTHPEGGSSSCVRRIRTHPGMLWASSCLTYWLSVGTPAHQTQIEILPLFSSGARCLLHLARNPSGSAEGWALLNFDQR